MSPLLIDRETTTMPYPKLAITKTQFYFKKNKKFFFFAEREENKVYANSLKPVS